MKEIYIRHIAGLLGLKDWQVENCADLFADGDTIPFISRYRKESTTASTCRPTSTTSRPPCRAARMRE